MANDIKILDHLNIDLDGDGIAERYEIGGMSELPIASSEVLGGVKIGENLTITEDGTLNAETSGTSVLSPGAVLYDTKEKVVGKWIDGKPIYEKVIYADITDREWHTIPLDVSIDLVVKLRGMLYQGDSNPIFIESQGNTYPNNSERSVLTYNKNDNFIQYGVLYSTSDLTSAYLYIIIQYTKTTDAENSFNIEMVENINLEQNIDFSNIYTTEERIIGSWVNGKPVYQKVIPFIATLNNNVWIETPELIDDKERIIQTFVIANLLYMPIMGNVDRDGSNYVRIWSMRSTICDITHVVIQYTKTTDEENSFTPDMIIDHENITDAEIEAAAAADKI